jgi:hypothetical protein
MGMNDKPSNIFFLFSSLEIFVFFKFLSVMFRVLNSFGKVYPESLKMETFQ